MALVVVSMLPLVLATSHERTCVDDQECTPYEICDIDGICKDWCATDPSAECCTWDDCPEPTTNPTCSGGTAVTWRQTCELTAEPDSATCSQAVTDTMDCPGGCCQPGVGCVSPGCSSDAECNDFDPSTTDTCVNAGTCSASCENNPASPICPDADTVDCGDPITPTNGVGSCSGTGTYCINMGDTCNTATGICEPPAAEVECNSNADCDDSNPCSVDTCVYPGTSNSRCTYTAVSGYHGTCVPGPFCAFAPNTMGACTSSCNVHADCVETPACGDGNLDSGEECDDGNTVNGDGCSAACEIETGSVCGNGVQEAGEECDDNNLIDGDGCSSSCQNEAVAPFCGDDICNNGETCNTCSGDCGSCPPGTCTPGSYRCAGSCELIRCNAAGDGWVTDELCSPNTRCTIVFGNQCIASPGSCGGSLYCGDGTCSVGEDCSSCAADCGACAVCGDGTCEAGEDCSSCSADCGSCLGPAPTAGYDLEVYEFSGGQQSWSDTAPLYNMDARHEVDWLNGCGSSGSPNDEKCTIVAEVDCEDDGTIDRTSTMLNRDDEDTAWGFSHYGITQPDACDYPTPGYYTMRGTLRITRNGDGAAVVYMDTAQIEVNDTCGNGNRESYEDCDGADLNGQTCADFGLAGSGLACDASCNFDTSACNLCGNGNADGVEDCDGADLQGMTCTDFGYAPGGSLACTSSCNYNFSGCALCGNGDPTDPGEQCDLGPPNGDDSDGCTDTCQYPVQQINITDVDPDPVDPGDPINVTINASIPRPSCIDVELFGNPCTWNGIWTGNQTTYTCNAVHSCPGTNQITVAVDTGQMCGDGGGDVYEVTLNLPVEETPPLCSNGIDDDCDGTIDGNDPTCTGRLDGYVRDVDGDPILGAAVTVISGSGNPVAGTDAAGYYLISGIRPGPQTVTAQKQGYRSTSVDIAFPSADIVQHNFTLNDGSCSECADWEGRCSVECSNTPLCGATVPTACDGVRPGEWTSFNSTHDVFCCAGATYKPKVNSEVAASGCMRNLIATDRLVRYHGRFVTMRIYMWEPCE